MRIDTTSGDFDFTYLSLGAGVQSSALLVLALTTDKVPTPDAVIFADTQDEPEWVNRYVRVLAEWSAERGVEVTTATAGRLSDHMVGRSMVPFYTAGKDGGREGMLLRKCSSEFKIIPIEKTVRGLLGYQPRQRIKESVRAMLGITIDEAQRMKPSRTRWITNTFPLVDLGLRRDDCLRIVADVGLPEPRRSACVYCPYHSDTYWNWLKTSEPEQFGRAVEGSDRCGREGTFLRPPLMRPAR
jgi:hypothetical protein